MTLLYCDFDGPIPAGLIPKITECCRIWGWPLEAIRYDRTRRGWHVVIGVRKRITPSLMVAAQAIFGSDWRREMFNAMRVQQLDTLPEHWRTRWNVLYVQHHHAVKIRDTSSPARRSA